MINGAWGYCYNGKEFSVCGSNYVDISSKCKDDLYECNISIAIYKKEFETIIEELQSNVTVLQDMIEVRDGWKACESLGMDAVLFIINDICIKLNVLKHDFYICISLYNNFPNFFCLFNLCVTICTYLLSLFIVVFLVPL